MRGIFQPDSRLFLLRLVAALVVGLVVSYAIVSPSKSLEFQSEKGVLDLSNVRVWENSVKLQGEWEFYWKELLSPTDIHNHLAKDEVNSRLISIPNSWLGYRLDGSQLDGTGFATFRLVIKLSEDDQNERLALRIPTIFHAYKLWVNGELLSEVGVVGQDRSSARPHLATKLVFFQPENDTVELVIQVANFHHKRGGMTKTIELGGSDVITAKTHLEIATEMFVTASLLVIGVYHLLLYTLRRKDKAPLYFGLFTLMFGIRSLLVGELLLTQLFPAFPWGVQFKIEYLILSSGGYMIMMYAKIIFPNTVSCWFHRSVRLVTGTLCVIILMTPALVFTKLLTVIGMVVVSLTVYLMIGLVREARKETEGALTFLLVSIVALVTIANDFLYYSEWSRIGNTSPIGLLVFTIAQMILISSRFTKTASNEEKITRELQDANHQLIELNTNLEKTVQERTHALSITHDELQTSYNLLLDSEQGRKKLLSYITHDLRMPLSSMLGYVELVQDGIKPEQNEQYLKYIQENTIRITRMIEDLSFLSHLETGQISYRMEPVSVLQFLRGFYEQYELVVRDAGVDFILDMGDMEDQRPNFPIIEADAYRLEQALFNLLSNALKFTPNGGLIRITLTEDRMNDAHYVVIGIQDSGTGIPSDQLEQIFERNYRYHRLGAKREMEGSGLGLAICREIIQAHGGAVRAESDGETGAALYVSLPCLLNEGRKVIGGE